MTAASSLTTTDFSCVVQAGTLERKFKLQSNTPLTREQWESYVNSTVKPKLQTEAALKEIVRATSDWDVTTAKTDKWVLERLPSPVTAAAPAAMPVAATTTAATTAAAVTPPVASKPPVPPKKVPAEPAIQPPFTPREFAIEVGGAGNCAALSVAHQLNLKNKDQLAVALRSEAARYISTHAASIAKYDTEDTRRMYNSIYSAAVEYNRGRTLNNLPTPEIENPTNRQILIEAYAALISQQGEYLDAPFFEALTAHYREKLNTNVHIALINDRSNRNVRTFDVFPPTSKALPNTNDPQWLFISAIPNHYRSVQRDHEDVVSIAAVRCLELFLEGHAMEDELRAASPLAHAAFRKYTDSEKGLTSPNIEDLKERIRASRLAPSNELIHNTYGAIKFHYGKLWKLIANGKITNADQFKIHFRELLRLDRRAACLMTLYLKEMRVDKTGKFVDAIVSENTFDFESGPFTNALNDLDTLCSSSFDSTVSKANFETRALSYRSTGHMTISAGPSFFQAQATQFKGASSTSAAKAYLPS
jgi:hypothetical protein